MSSTDIPVPNKPILSARPIVHPHFSIKRRGQTLKFYFCIKINKVLVQDPEDNEHLRTDTDTDRTFRADTSGGDNASANTVAGLQNKVMVN